MSRVAKNPIPIPAGVNINIREQELTIKGKQGELHYQVHPMVKVLQEEGEIRITTASNEEHGALAGTTRALVNNMVKGVSEGFTRKLELVGVGYRAQAQGDKINLTLGFSHPVVYDLPKGITAETPSQTEILIKGVDKQLVGQVAAEIRSYRPPEPYKGKGVRYAGEKIELKEVKKK